MKAKYIDLSKKRAKGAGVMGSYFQLSKLRGVKVIGLSVFYPEDGGHEACDLKRSTEWREARNEYKLLKKVKKLVRQVPSAYYLVPVCYKGRWFPGIVMQHIQGKCLSCVPGIDSEGVMKALDRKFKRKGVHYYDFHDDNVIKSGKRYWVIDFSPGYTDIVLK